MTASAPEHRTKRELAVHKVRGAIMAGRYRPGQALRQSQLMADPGLGATPAREAALELVAKGLLVHESHRGVRVAELEADRVAQVYNVRALLEAEAARLAVLSATDEIIERLSRHARAMEEAVAAGDLARLGIADGRFHHTLCEGAGNPMLLTLIEQMWEQFPRYMLWRRPERVRESLQEHGDIFAAFAGHDAPATARAVRRHILHGLDAFHALLRDTELDREAKP